MSTLIANGEGAVHAQLHRLSAEQPGFDVIAETSSHLDARLTTSDHGAGLWPPKIIGEKSGRIYFLDVHQVEYVAAAGNYVVAHVGPNEFLARATLKHVAARLEPLGFVRIERSLLINLRQVAHVERHERGQFCFVMLGGARLVSSRERSSDIRALLLGAMTPQYP